MSFNIKRRKIFFLTADRLLKVLEGRLEIVGFPDDCKFISINANWQMNAVEICIVSETFDEVPDGELPPQLEDITMSFKAVEVGRHIKESGLEVPVLIAVKENAVQVNQPGEKIKFREFI